MVALDEGASVFLRAWARRASVFLLGLDNRGGVNGSGWASFRVVQPVAPARSQARYAWRLVGECSDPIARSGPAAVIVHHVQLTGPG